MSEIAPVTAPLSSINKTPDQVLADIRQSIDAEIAKATAALPEARRVITDAAAVAAHAASRERAFDARIHNLLKRIEGARGELAPDIAAHRASLTAEIRNANAAVGKAEAKVLMLEATLRTMRSAADQLKFIGA